MIEIKTGPFSGQTPVFLDDEPAVIQAFFPDMSDSDEKSKQVTVAITITNGIKFAGVYLSLNEAEEFLTGLLKDVKEKINEQT